MFKSKPFHFEPIHQDVTAELASVGKVRLVPVANTDQPDALAYIEVYNTDVVKDSPKLSCFFNDETGKNPYWQISTEVGKFNILAPGLREALAEVGIYVNRFKKFTTDAPRTPSEKAANAKKPALGRSVAATVAAQADDDDDF